MLLVEYIDYVTRKITRTAMGTIGDVNGVVMMNGVSVGLNKLLSLIKETIKDEKAEHISLISRKKIEKKEILK